jgi:ribonucleotide monophosphatase NagD (HAD superfamily)
VGDLDGCLLCHSTAIPGVPETVQIINKPLCEIDPINFKDDNQKIPFIGFTNRGGELESEAIEIMNNAFHLYKEDEKLKETQVIVNFSALRPIIQSYSQQLILVIGGGDQGKVIESCGTTNYLTIYEYCTLFPYMVPVSRDKQTKEEY